MRLTAGSAGKRHIQAVVFGLVILGLIWQMTGWIITGSNTTLTMFGLGLIVVALAVYILNDWRFGVVLFLIWLLFEDLVRKYLGNSMTIFFAKDLLVGFAYMSYLFARRKKRAEAFKIPFLVPLTVFFCFAFIQVFNTHSPSIFYGLLGLKLYFYYVPLMLLGYAMMVNPKDLEQFLTINILAGVVIAGLGIAQSVLGVTFLMPDDMAPELYGLSHEIRYSPVTNQMAFAPSSVFVSGGRFSWYLILLWILAMGAMGYLLLNRRSDAKYAFLGIGVVTVAVLNSGTRTPFVFVLSSAFVMSAAFLWGAPWKWGQGHRLVKALRRAFLVGGFGLILMAAVFPTVIGGNWAFMSETLSFTGEGSELVHRSWEYPVLNLTRAFQYEHWISGYGTGTNSLGLQYVARFLSQPYPTAGVESGYGSLIVEMGVLGPVLWIIWVSTLLWSGWRVIRQLRQTAYFPIGFAIWWYCCVDLIFILYLSMAGYQNYVNNAYLWLLVGILFRLPKLAQMPQPVPIPKRVRAMSRWQLATGRR